MNILFLVNSFKRGGAERVIINLLNYFPKLNSNLNLFLYFLEDAHDPYPVPIHVELIKRSRKPTFHSTKFLNLPLQALQLKKYIRNHDINLVISFLSRSNYVNILAKIFGASHQAIMSERNTPSMMYRSGNIADLVNRILIRKLYPRYHKLIAVSGGVKNDLVTNFNIPEQNISVIYNPFDFDRILKYAEENIDHPWMNDPNIITIVSLGRLEKPKNHSLLIHAFQMVIDRIKNVRLILIGEGTERPSLTQLIEELDLDSSIALIGQKDNPYPYLAKADLFVLSSNTEGFPNVLIEAMICGCPVISTDCQSGPNEIIRNTQNGYLVPVGDIDSLSQTIVDVLQNDNLHTDLKNKARETVKKFELSKIVQQYYQTLTQD